MLQTGLDLPDHGITVFDAKLVWSLEPSFLELLEFPRITKVGMPFERFIQATQNGNMVLGDFEAQIAERVAAAEKF